MSFILEALKKSEKKQQKKSGQTVRTVYEPAPLKKGSPRWGIGLLILLLFNGALLLWFFAPWQQSSQSVIPSSTMPTEVKQAEPGAATTRVSPPTSAPVEKNTLAGSVTGRQQSAVAQLQPAVNPLPVPRNDKKVYHFSRLPVAIQQRIPPLKMSLHGYNRENPNASLVQINDHILHEGEMVTGKIRLDKITAEGAVLHYDGYRFLLPRRGTNNI